LKSKPRPKTGIGLLAGIYGLQSPAVDPVEAESLIESSLNDISPLQRGDREGRSWETEFSKAISDWINGIENHEMNGIEPWKHNGDREDYLRDFRAFMMGDSSHDLRMEESWTSDLASGLEKQTGRTEIRGIDVEEAVERAGHHLANTYWRRQQGSHGAVRKNNGSLHLEAGADSVGENTVRLVKLHGPKELDEFEAGILASELGGDKAEIIYPLEEGDQGFWGRTEEVDLKEVENLLGGEINTQRLLDDASAHLKDIFEEAAEQVERETGLFRSDIDPYDYLRWVSETDLSEVSIPASTEVGDLLLTNKDLSEVSEMLSARSGPPRRGFIDSTHYIDSVAVSSDVQETDIQEAVRLAYMNKLEELHSRVRRGKDREGRRIYRWDGNLAYSVTTVLESEFIDTGGALFHWKNRYDGEDSYYEAENVSDFASVRGSLAHVEVFSNYVPREAVVEGGEENIWRELEDTTGEELENIRRWRGTAEDEFYSGEVAFENARDIVEEDLSWINEEFRSLEKDLGINEDSILAAEKMFGIQTALSWDESSGIGEFSYSGQIDLLYEHEETGETILLDLKTSKELHDDYKIQSSAYAHAIENSDFFDVDEVDRIMIPVINPETMKDDDREPVVHTDQPLISQYDSEIFETSEFRDASGLQNYDDVTDQQYFDKVDSEVGRERKLYPENLREEYLYLFARAADDMPEIKI